MLPLSAITRRHGTRLLAASSLLAVLAGCSGDTEPATSPEFRSLGHPPDLHAALAAQARYSARLMTTRGVVGTAVGLDHAGRPAVKVFTVDAAAVLPAELDGVPVAAEVTGRVFARSDPTTRQRPAPLGFSVGHPDITAGTIGARVKDALGNVYILSNNHVLANMNSANLNDSALQPGPYDGGTDPADRIGGLADFEPLALGYAGYGEDPPSNYIDAAIASSDVSLVSSSTPTDDGYGVPSATIAGDVDPADGTIDDVSLLLGLNVQKYGRTTKLTQGQVVGVNVIIDVCYDIFCFSMGRFFDQIEVCCAGFSDGGDSGSLIVTSGTGKNPVALLFAGGGSQTFGNRIDRVLNRFGVTIDASAAPPPPPPPPPQSMHVGDLDGVGSITARTWKVAVTIKVVDASDNPVSGATVAGKFTNGATGNATCTTGTAGTCFVTKTKLRSGSVTYSVTNVTRSGLSYQSGGNTDPDGDSNGTTITVVRP